MRSIKIILLFCVMGSQIQAQNTIGIGAGPHSRQALLDLVSNEKGFLLPRMTSTERFAIDSLDATDESMLVYDTDSSAFYFWKDSMWVELGEQIAFTQINDDDWIKDTLTGDLIAGNSANVGVGTTAPPLAKFEVRDPGQTAGFFLTSTNLGFATHGVNLHPSGSGAIFAGGGIVPNVLPRSGISATGLHGGYFLGAGTGGTGVIGRAVTTQTGMGPVTIQPNSGGSFVGQYGVFAYGTTSAIRAVNPGNNTVLIGNANAAIIIQDGTQADGRVLTSNALGFGTWQESTQVTSLVFGRDLGSTLNSIDVPPYAVVSGCDNPPGSDLTSQISGMLPCNVDTILKATLHCAYPVSGSASTTLLASNTFGCWGCAKASRGAIISPPAFQPLREVTIDVRDIFEDIAPEDVFELAMQHNSGCGEIHVYRLVLRVRTKGTCD